MSQAAVVAIWVLDGFLALQGICLLGRAKRSRHDFWCGILAIVLAGFSGCGLSLFSRGALVRIPAFGAMVVEGMAHCVLRTSLILVAVASALLVISARAARERADRAWPILITAVVVGTIAAFEVTPLSAQLERIQLFAYDLSSPLLLCWVAGCVIQWTLVVVGYRGHLFGFWIAALLAEGMALLSSSHPNDLYIDGSTPHGWQVVQILGWFAAVTSGIGLAVCSLFPRAFDHRRSRQVMRWSLAVALGLLSLLPYLMIFEDAQGSSRGFLGVVVLGVVAAIPLFRAIGHWRHGWAAVAGTIWRPGRPRRGDQGVTPPADTAAANQDPRPSRSIDFILIPTFLLVLWFSADLIFFAKWPIALNLAALTLAAIVLIELTSEGPIRGAGPGVGVALWGSHSLIRLGLGRIFGVLLQALKRALPARAPVAGRSKLMVAFMVVAAVVVLQELPNRGKTLIYPFALHSASPSDAVMGEMATERIANTMGRLVDQLHAEMLVDSDGKQLSMVTLDGSRNTGLDTALVGDLLPLGEVKIPLGAVLGPFRGPFQHLVGARVISGSIHKAGGGYHLLVSASTGETWHEAIAQGPAPGAGTCSATAGLPVREDAAALALFQQVDALAYRIVSTEPAWARGGMTTSPEAFDLFSKGLAAWKNYQAAEGIDDKVTDRLEAIRCFRQAIQIDPKFAVAFHQLGLTLRADGQPQSAVGAFQMATTINPSFAAAKNALASTLFDYDTYLPPVSAAVEPDRRSDRATWNGRQRARAQWEDIVADPDRFPSAADRGSAYLGLCRADADPFPSQWRPKEAANDCSNSAPGADRLRQCGKAYYFCARADAIYSALGSHSSPDILKTRARILISQVALLKLAGDQPDKDRSRPVVEDAPEQTVIGCDGLSASLTGDGSSSARPLKVGWTMKKQRFDDQVTELVAQAHAVMPDDFTIACEAARLAWVGGNKGPMRALVKNERAHLSLGDVYRDRGKGSRDRTESSRWFSLARQEFARALKWDPNNVEAMNSYADTFWVSRLPDHDSKLGPVDDQFLQEGALAERYARTAVRLASGQGKSETSRLVYQSTLAEILLLLGRPHEAIEVLEPVKAPPHVLYDETRWVLAQAYSCAGYMDRHDHSLRKPERCSNHINRAAHIYDTIRENEQLREFQAYSRLPDSLDPMQLARACRDPRPIPDKVVSYSAAACEHTMGVEVPRDHADFAVHIWGRGIDAVAGRASAWRVNLATPPTDTHQQYFWQAVRAKNGTPVSPVYSFRTFADRRRNLIKLSPVATRVQVSHGTPGTAVHLWGPDVDRFVDQDTDWGTFLVSARRPIIADYRWQIVGSNDHRPLSEERRIPGPYLRNKPILLIYPPSTNLIARSEEP